MDLSDSFYHLDINVDDIPKLGVVFPTTPNDEQLITFLLVLPVGWTTIADIANQCLISLALPPSHHLNDLAASILPPDQPTLRSALDLTDLPRDPSLPSAGLPLSYIDVFVDDFIGIAQDSTTFNLCHNRETLLCATDNIFCTLGPHDSPQWQELVSIKKLLQGDCSWGTCKTILG